MAHATRSRPVRSREIVFLSTIVILSLFTLYSFTRAHYWPTSSLSSSSSSVVLRTLQQEPDLECRRVHDAHDKCAFVKANCPDEEAGLISYLQLYYCDLAHVKPIAFTIIVVWISLLFSSIGIAASDFLCINLSTIAAILGMSESLTGVTFLAFGNGSPDVFSTFAAMSSNSGSLAVGELMGAACFITAVVAGSMALVKPFKVAKKSFVRDVGFFTVAASFSLVFLRDGSLRLWECVTMVAFYLFYVIFVVLWHWWLQRRKRIQLAETSARLHHHIPQHQELETPGIEIDEEAQSVNERSSLMRSESENTLPRLLTPGTPAWQAREADDDDEVRDHYLAELRNNMRVSRTSKSRRNTITPIRPSLIGAIEFRSVMNALERRATTNRPIGLRQYSDDSSMQNDITGNIDASNSQPHFVVYSADTQKSHDFTANRNRAVSANDAEGLRLHPDLLTGNQGTPETAIYSPAARSHSRSSHQRSYSDFGRDRQGSFSSQVLASPLTMSSASGASTPGHSYVDRNGLLAPPTNTGFGQPNYFGSTHHDVQPSPAVSPRMAGMPKIQIPQPEHRKLPSQSQAASLTSTPASTRPPSMHLPPPVVTSPGSGPGQILEREGRKSKMFWWWPYNHLPAPETICSTLFPTLCGWQERGIIGKILAIVSVPTIFLFTITLPVVEPKDDNNEPLDDVMVASTSPAYERRPTLAELVPDSPILSRNAHPPISASPHPHNLSRHNTDNKFAGVEPEISNQREWSRWLVIVQLFTAPMFIMLIVWANMDESHSEKELLIFVMSSLVFSLVGLLGLLLTTSADREPGFRPVFCFLGFFVAIAWISTIANEVVGVLKTLGVILNISDAILGLTIFAVGNSLGDLVADITVAKLGFPVMALSACFGGPMLNILLGIGIGGLYMTIHKEQHWHHKHPDRPVKYKPYELEVSTTLVISGITLLVTLVGLLIFVPLNGWRMDRKIGIGLITLWTLSTIGNVVCEILGLGTEGIEKSHYL